MIPAPPTPYESERLRELRRFCLLDTPSEEIFDELIRLAALICDVPMALISLVDEDRQWFKSRIGIDVAETGLDVSFCIHAIRGEDLFVVEDATKDPRFSANPLVTGSPNIRFYAGMPLTTKKNLPLGSFCVLDHKPRILTPQQRAALEILGREATRIAEMRSLMVLQERHAVFQNIVLTHAASAIITTNPDGLITQFNPAAERMLQMRAHDLVGKATPEVFHIQDEVNARAQELSRQLNRTVEPGFGVFVAHLHNGEEETRTWTYRRADGSTFPVLLSVSPIKDQDGEIIGYLSIARDITEQKKTEEELRNSEVRLNAVVAELSLQKAMLADLRYAQDHFIDRPETSAAFDDILAILLRYTHSEYGFVGEVLTSEEGEPYLKTHALTNISWDDATRKFYEDNAPQGLEFRNLMTLFGHVMTSGRPVIANAPYSDPRRGGLPAGHPPLNAFLGIPIMAGTDMVGMMGVANRPGGYSENILKDIAPLIASYASLIQARRNRLLRQDAEFSLRESEARLQRVVNASGLGYWDWNMVTSEIIFSGAWESMLGYADQEIERSLEAWFQLIHPDDQPSIRQAFKEQTENHANSYSEECRMRAKDGSWRWILTEGGVTERDTEGRARRITGIHKYIHDQKVVAEQARQLTKTKTLIQEVHHRVKNNLQVVASLLSFQEDQLNAHPELANQFQITKSRVAAIASLHELLYRSSYPDKITMAALIHELVSQACAVFGIRPDHIRVELQIEEVLIHYNQAAPFALILNELITNAFKHAFPDGCQGRISVTAGEDTARSLLFLRVADDGTGMPTEADAGVTPSSLGMTLVQRLADQLGGTLQRLPVEHGTAWELSFSPV